MAVRTTFTTTTSAADAIDTLNQLLSTVATLTGSTALAISGAPGSATQNAAYSYTPAVSGGTGGTKTFTLTGTLLAGLVFSATTGRISGTPTATGTMTGLKIAVTDGTYNTSQTVSITVAAAAAAVSAAFRTTTAMTTPFAQTALPTFSAAGPASARFVIDRTATKQPWYGVGASMTGSTAYCLTYYMSAAQRTAAIQDFWGDSGVGLMRICIGDSDFNGRSGGTSGYKTYDDVANDTTLANFDASGDLTFLIPRIKDVLAVNPNIKILACPWSPPAWMKSNNSLIGSSGAWVNSVQNMTTYAQYFVKFIQFYQAQGVPIWQVSVQNEPNFVPGDYPGCAWNVGDQITFVRDYLKPAIAAAGLTTGVMGGEVAHWETQGSYVKTPVSTSPTTFDAYSYHGYAGSPTVAVSDGATTTGKPVLMTELCTGTFLIGASAAAEFAFFGGIVGCLAVNNGHWGMIFWNWILDQQGYPFKGNLGTVGGAANEFLHGVVTVNNATGVITNRPEYYFLKHFSKYAPVGSSVLSVRQTGGSTDIQCCAIRNGTSVTALLYNTSSTTISTSVTDQVSNSTTSISVGPGEFTTITYPDQAALPVTAPSVSVTVTGGNATNVLAINAQAQGSAITSLSIFRGTTAGGGTELPLSPITSPTSDASGNITGLVFQDTTATVGVQYYYKVRANSAAGNTTSTEVSIVTPPADAVSHYMILPTGRASTGARALPNSGYNVPNNYFDISAWMNLDAYGTAAPTTGAIQPFVGDWPASGTTTNVTFCFGFRQDTSLLMFLKGLNGGGQGFPASTIPMIPSGAAAAGQITPSATTGVWVRAVVNCQSVAVNGFAANTVSYFTSPDGTTWTKLGNSVSVGFTIGIATPTPAQSPTGMVVGDARLGDTANPSVTGKIYKVTSVTETGAIIFNTDFTAQSSGVTSFTDNGVTPKTWTFQNGAVQN